MRNQKRKGRNVSVSHGWWESFRKRHPNIILRTASPLSHVRTVGSNPIILSRYFDLLEITLQENELHDKPSQIFAGSGTKNSQAPASGDKSHIIVLACWQC